MRVSEIMLWTVVDCCSLKIRSSRRFASPNIDLIFRNGKSLEVLEAEVGAIVKLNRLWFDICCTDVKTYVRLSIAVTLVIGVVKMMKITNCRR